MTLYLEKLYVDHQRTVRMFFGLHTQQRYFKFAYDKTHNNK